MELWQDIAEYLKEYHTTEADAIKNRELRELFNLTDRQVRRIVHELRCKGVAICSSSEGYWYSENRADIKRTLHKMEAQIQDMEYSIAGLYKALKEV